MFDRLRRAIHSLGPVGAEDRPHFQRIDVSPARYDDGAWLTRSR